VDKPHPQYEPKSPTTTSGAHVSGTHEYDIIARFSAFVLALSLPKKSDVYASDSDNNQARVICEEMAFEVCCASIHHYKTWNGLLNSATFE